MPVSAKEMRLRTGLSQAEFAKTFNIPVSTLRKWEQGESTPPDYVLELIASSLPATNTDLERISGRNDAVFYFDKNKNQLLDTKGNTILISESLDGVKKQNLRLYVSDLFDSFYDAQKKFNDDCRIDKQEDILWTD